MARKTLTEKRTLYTGLQKGMRTRWRAHDPLWLDKVPYSPNDIDGILQELLDAIRAVELAEGALRGAVAARNTLERKYRTLVGTVVHVAQTEYGQDRAALGAFALKPAGKPGPKKLEVKVVSAEKARETRKQRAAMGPRQRKRLKPR